MYNIMAKIIPPICTVENNHRHACLPLQTPYFKTCMALIKEKVMKLLLALAEAKKKKKLAKTIIQTLPKLVMY